MSFRIDNGESSSVGVVLFDYRVEVK
jgi:hypothetical protein